EARHREGCGRERPLRLATGTGLVSGGSRMDRHRLLAAAFVLASLAAALPASAGDPAVAKILFDQGVDLMELGQYERACPNIAESYKLDPRPGTLFALAECESKWGHVATAVARYEEYLALFATLPPDKRASQREREATATSQKALLASQVPRLTL